MLAPLNRGRAAGEAEGRGDPLALPLAEAEAWLRAVARLLSRERDDEACDAALERMGGRFTLVDACVRMLQRRWRHVSHR
jgi:hypothetical protein